MSFSKLFTVLALSAAAAYSQSATVASTFKAQPSISPEIMTNESVVALADAGFSNAFIVEKILISDRTRFDTSAEGLAYLRRNAIPQDLVQFIVEHAAQPVFAPPVPQTTPVTLTTPVKMKKIRVPVGSTVTVSAPAAPVIATPTASLVAAQAVSPVPQANVAAPAIAPVVPIGIRPSFYGTWQGVAAPAYSYAPGYSYVQVPYGVYGYPTSVVAPVVAHYGQTIVALTGAWWR